MLDRDLLPRLGQEPAELIQPNRVGQVVQELLDRSPTAGRRARQVLSGIFAWAVARHLVSRSPVVGIPVPRGGQRERVLSEGELGGLVPELRERSGTFARILLLTLLTAQRPGYVCAMRRDEIEGRWWRARTKRGLSYRVYLSDAAMQVLPTGTKAYIFPARLGAKLPHYRLESMHTSIRALRAHLGLAHWTPHDLRRTAATQMARLKIAEPFLISRILGHTDPRGVTSIYDRASREDEIREALGNWGAWVAAL